MILITGGGFIGGALAASYADAALTVRRTRYNNRDIAFNLTDTEHVDDLINMLKDRHISCIIHTAAVTPWSDNPDYSQDLMMAETVAKLSEALRVESFVFISGWNVYDMTHTKAPYNEETPLGSDNDYGKCKIAVEHYLNDMLKTAKLTCLRLASVYGPGQISPGLITNLVASAMKNNVMKLSAKDTKRDYIYIDDMVAAVRSAMRISGKQNMVLNIGNGNSISVEYVARSIANAYKRVTAQDVSTVVSHDLQESQVIDNCLDISRAQTFDMLKLQTSFDIGIEAYIRWRLR